MPVITEINVTRDPAIVRMVSCVENMESGGGIGGPLHPVALQVTVTCKGGLAAVLI